EGGSGGGVQRRRPGGARLHSRLGEEPPGLEGDRREHPPRLADERRGAPALERRTGPAGGAGVDRYLLDEAPRLGAGALPAAEELLDGQRLPDPEGKVPDRGSLPHAG